MVGLGLLRAHGIADDVAVSARPDAAAYDHDHPVARLGANALQQADPSAVHVVERLLRIAEPGAPVVIRTPGRRVEHDAEPWRFAIAT